MILSAPGVSPTSVFYGLVHLRARPNSGPLSYCFRTTFHWEYHCSTSCSSQLGIFLLYELHPRQSSRRPPSFRITLRGRITPVSTSYYSPIGNTPALRVIILHWGYPCSTSFYLPLEVLLLYELSGMPLLCEQFVTRRAGVSSMESGDS